MGASNGPGEIGPWEKSKFRKEQITYGLASDRERNTRGRCVS